MLGVTSNPRCKRRVLAGCLKFQADIVTSNFRVLGSVVNVIPALESVLFSAKNVYVNT